MSKVTGRSAIGACLVCSHPELKIAAERLVIAALTAEAGSITHTARALGVPARTLHRWIAISPGLAHARAALEREATQAAKDAWARTRVSYDGTVLTGAKWLSGRDY